MMIYFIKFYLIRQLRPRHVHDAWTKSGFGIYSGFSFSVVFFVWRFSGVQCLVENMLQVDKVTP